MGMLASQITSLTIVYSIVYSDADQRKHQSSASLAFVRGFHRGPVNSPHKWPVPFDDVIMLFGVQFRQCFGTEQSRTIAKINDDPLHWPVYVSPRINMLIDMASWHCSDVIMRAMASQITGISIIYSSVCSGTDQRCSGPLAFVKGILRWPANSPQRASYLEYVSIPWRHHEILSKLFQVIACRQFHTKP